MSLFLLPSISTANDWNRLTTTVFNRPVQIPGQVLPAGIYVFKLADFSGDHNIVQIWDADQTVLLATVLGFPEYLSTGPSEDLFIFEERSEGAPTALISWFHRGNPNGERFIYPKSSER
jgi:hypothetical protein